MASPNSASAIRVSGDLTTTGATAATGIVATTIDKASTGGVQVLGTFTATLQFEQSLDGGTTWIAKTVYPAAGGAGVTSATGTGQWKFTIGGMSNFRVRCSAFTSGPASVALVLTKGADFSAVPIGGLPASLGPKTPALSLAVIPAVLTPYRLAAGVTTTAFGATGAAGDYLSHVVLQPAAVGAGTTTIFNNATAVYIYTSGTLSDLRPIIVPIGALSSGGSWNATTGSNMAVTGFGTFT